MAKATPTKEERNNKIFTLKQDPEIKATFAALAVMFNISEWRVKEIYYRECEKRGIQKRKYVRRK